MFSSKTEDYDCELDCKMWQTTPHIKNTISVWTSLVAQTKNLSAMREIWVQSVCQEDPMENEMATHSSILAWRTPWTEEPVRLHSVGLQRVGHD